MSSKLIFYALIVSGIVFIIIGTISIYDSNIAKPVSINGSIEVGKNDTLTPIMEIGSRAKISLNGSNFDFTIYDPDKKIIFSTKNRTNLSYELIANKSGEFKLATQNTGTNLVSINGTAETKAIPLAFGAQMMLIITGIILAGLGIRSRFR
ncbi:MAG TPA: hypothetical protein VH415_12060 [Nitrososphaeraceae archaeon]|jgi:hypothetical protein